MAETSLASDGDSLVEAAVDLDDLSSDQLDALPFGAIKVDGRGRIELYNAAESRLSGRAVETVIGRDFFREVAPCTHQIGRAHV